MERQIQPNDFNSYGARRGNHHIMMRGTFGNIRIKNPLGGRSRVVTPCTSRPARRWTFYDAAMKYEAEGTPLVIVAGKEYGTGSSRDWAAKGMRLLGVKAVIAESSSGSTAPTSSAWACCPRSSRTATASHRWA